MGLWATFIQGLLQGAYHKVRCHAATEPSAHNTPGKHIHHKGNVQPTLPSAHLCEVRYPQLVGALRVKVAVDTGVLGQQRWCACAGHAARPLAATLHESLDRAAGHRNTFLVHLCPHLIYAVDLPDPLDIWYQLLVALSSLAAKLGVALTRSMAPVTKWGHLQCATNGLDPIEVAVLINKTL